jgi:hypothetical protein
MPLNLRDYFNRCEVVDTPERRPRRLGNDREAGATRSG